GSRDPVALRGADLLVIDARRSPAIDARVAEVRSDVRARWASVATIDYTSLVGSEGTVDLRALDGVVSRLAGMDKALTERARKEEKFETILSPLGPTRTLRALALAGPTLHVTLSDGELNAKVDLAHELLVSAVADRKGASWEAWSALAHVIGLTDANVVVERRANATVMNIMEPVDQALESAAQERAQHPEQFAQEQSEELSGLRGERRSEQPVAQPVAKVGGSIAPVARARTLVGVPAPRPPAGSTPSKLPPPSPASLRPSPFKAPGVPREAFADTPTDPAAPGLLQRMAQTPANDADIEIRAKRPSEPVLEVEKQTLVDGDDDDLGGDSSEYDTGEVTVVADASQLDILRQTLDSIDQPGQNEPLTSTMPAPKGPAPDSGDLELDEALRNAAQATATAEVVPSAPPTALPVADSAARSLRLNPSLRPPQKQSGSRAWVLVVLALLAIASVGWMVWAQQHKTAKKPPAASPR
ncbi:MAG TPA: hypothetical protein VFX59_03920, partial [Polyangiales bacterium]|nr:hypothetical protein [Polyangiales bacterium]